MAQHNDSGKKGELLAVEFLLKLGYRIIVCNWRYQHKEVDIIAEINSILVFVEVKLRSTNYYGQPEEWVTAKKQQLLIEAANAYLETLTNDPLVRFDIISIVGFDGNYTIDHIVDAFSA